MSDDTNNTDTLKLMVTDAIWRAEQLEEGDIQWAKVSFLEESLANALPASQPEGRIARRGAVRAALKARDFVRAQSLVGRYLAEDDVPPKLKAALNQLLQTGRA